MNETNLLSTSQVARRIDKSASWVRLLAASGTLRGTKTPIGMLFDAADVDAYLAERAKQREAPMAAR